MIPLLALVLLACKSGDECIPFSGGAPMPTGWMPWMDTQRAEFANAGECPDAPPERAVWADGCEYEVEAEILAPERITTLNRFSYGVMSFEMAFRDHLASSTDPDRYLGGIQRHALEPTPAPVFHGGGGLSAVEPGDTGDFTAELGMATSEGGTWDSAVYTYAWACLEVLEPAAREWGGADASGSAFFHVETWRDGAFPPGNYFFLIEHNDEAFAEDASGQYYEYGGYTTWPGDCDGVDNDMDGEVDEFADDCDGNGVADCLEYETEDAPACG